MTEVFIALWEVFKAVIASIWAMVPSFIEIKKILDVFSTESIIAMYIGVPTVVVSIGLFVVKRLINRKRH